MIRSRICDMLGIRYPVFQGGMAWIADASLASAVSNAGGLGIISSINAVPSERLCRKVTVTEVTWQVNVLVW